MRSAVICVQYFQVKKKKEIGKEKFLDEDGIRTHACRAESLSNDDGDGNDNAARQ